MPALCLESPSEMEKLSYLFTLQPVGKIWQRVWGGKITCHWNLSESQDRLSEMPARDELCRNSSQRKLLSEVYLVVLKDITEEITKMESEN